MQLRYVSIILRTAFAVLHAPAKPGLALVLVAACGGTSHVKRQTIGGGAAAVQARGAVETTPPTAIAVRPGTYEVKLRFELPRAQLVEWTVLCPGVTESGVVGETAEQYRARRIAELRMERARERQRVAAVTGAIVGAALPDVHASAQASGPNTTARIDAHVPGEAIGAAAGTAIANATVSDTIELAAGDVGAATIKTKLSIATAGDGTCTVMALADDANVQATFELVRIRDLEAEARARDPKLQARIAVQARLRAEALGVRGELVHYLTGECHARADHRQYLLDEPLAVRAALREYLIALGARERPPMPPSRPETPGPSPYDDGEWVAGHWIWTGVEWYWEIGVWRDRGEPRVRDHRTADVSNPRDHRTDSWSSSRDHRSEPTVRDHRSEPTVRDHRSETKSEPTQVVRDHRDKDKDNDKDDKKKDDGPSGAGPKVRDHRR